MFLLFFLRFDAACVGVVGAGAPTLQVLTPAGVLIAIELARICIWVEIQDHDVTVQDVLLQTSHDLDIRRVPAIEVFPDRW